MSKLCKFLFFTIVFIFNLAGPITSQENPTQLWHEAVDAIFLLDERDFQINNEKKPSIKFIEK